MAANIAAAQLASSAGSGVMNTLSGIGQTLVNFGLQKKMADYQYQKDLEMWNRQNEYNSPSEQVKRVEAAGLNPNLIFGSGVVGNTGSQMPHYQAPMPAFNIPEMRPLDVMSVMSNYEDIRIKQQQVSNLQEVNQQLKLDNAFKQSQLPYFGSYARSKADYEASKSIYMGAKGLMEGWKSDAMLEYLPEYQRSVLANYQLSKLKADNYKRVIDSEIELRNQGALSKMLSNVLNKMGINWSDDPAIRSIGMFRSGQDTKGMMPYVIGNKALGIIEKGIPKVNFGKQTREYTYRREF